MPVDPSNYAEVVSKINSKYNNALKKGDKIENPGRISSGSLELDIAMGGGIPMGRTTRLAGPYSSGKSLTAWSIIKSAQALNLNCAYYNVEKQYTPEFTASRGVDIEKLEIVDVTTIEGIAEIMESLMGVCHVHVVDSTKQAVSEDALNASIRDWRPGLEARAWGKAFDIINNAMDYTENIVVLIDQVRVKNFQSGADEPAGGKVLDHASSMTVVYRKGGWLFYDEEGYLDDNAKQNKNEDGQSVPAGRVIQARVDKSRVSRPLLPATMWLDLNTNEFDRAFEIMKHGKHTGLIENPNRGSYVINYNGDSEKFRGKAKVRKFINENPEFAEEVRTKALASILKK